MAIIGTVAWSGETDSHLKERHGNNPRKSTIKAEDFGEPEGRMYPTDKHRQR